MNNIEYKFNGISCNKVALLEQIKEKININNTIEVEINKSANITNGRVKQYKVVLDCKLIKRIINSSNLEYQNYIKLVAVLLNDKFDCINMFEQNQHKLESSARKYYQFILKYMVDPKDSYKKEITEFLTEYMVALVLNLIFKYALLYLESYESYFATYGSAGIPKISFSSNVVKNKNQSCYIDIQDARELINNILLNQSKLSKDIKANKIYSKVPGMRDYALITLGRLGTLANKYNNILNPKGILSYFSQYKKIICVGLMLGVVGSTIARLGR